MTDKTRTGLRTGHYNGKKPSWGAAVTAISKLQEGDKWLYPYFDAKSDSRKICGLPQE
jgi:hypothetical protein